MKSESRFTQFALVATIALVGAVFIFVVLNREPRFEGKKASVWFSEAQRDQRNLHPYGEVFVGWGDAGAKFLARRLKPTRRTSWKRQLADLYNRYGPRVGLSRIPWRSTANERRTAQKLLGYFESTAVPTLLSMLDEPSETNRVVALRAMAELGPSVADELGPHLVPLLKDASYTIQYEAVTTLAAIGYDPDGLVPLVVPFLTHQNGRHRIEASYALGHFAPQPEVTLDQLMLVISDTDQVAKANAIRALGKIGPEARIAIGPLTLLLKNESRLRLARTLEALPFITETVDLDGSPDYERGLQKILSDNDQYNIMMVSRAQVQLGRPANKMQAACNHLLKSQSNWQVWEAVDALAELDPMPGWARTLLEKGTRHPNGLVRTKAQAALAR